MVISESLGEHWHVTNACHLTQPTVLSHPPVPRINLAELTAMATECWLEHKVQKAVIGSFCLSTGVSWLWQVDFCRVIVLRRQQSPQNSASTNGLSLVFGGQS